MHNGHIRSLSQKAKSNLLPHTPRVLTIPWGVGRGIRMPIDPQHELRMWLGLYEIEIARHLRRLVGPDMTCYDVGAQFGYDGLVLARLSRGPVISFEANGGLIPRIDASFALNRSLAEKLIVKQAFVGTGKSGSLALDEFAMLQPPDFIKIDVDGGELDVLLGAERILSTHRPALVIETHSMKLEEQCGRVLVAHGYSPTVVHQRRILPDRRPIPHNRWLVCG